MRAMLARAKSETLVDAAAPVVFARPNHQVWGFLSPVYAAPFEVDGWTFSCVDMFMNASKAKVMGREDLWKKVLQGRFLSTIGLMGRLEREKASVEIKGMEVQLDGERNEEEKRWGGGELPILLHANVLLIIRGCI
jgi:predicted NAD-dependent protein-ADP-ribosyltransferase YbiA (DUF1768 family)